jgi:outer membrane protein assembly factor BamB
VVIRKFILLILLTFPFCSCTRTPFILWTTPTGGPVYGSPTYSDGHIFIGSQDKNLYALNASDGKVSWKTNLGARVVATPVIRNGSLFIGSGNGEFYSLNPKTGKTNWSTKTEGLIHYFPCMDDTGLYFGNDRGQFIKITYEGEILWTYKTTNKFNGECNFYKDFVLTSSWDYNFYALKKNDGTVAWKVSSGTLNYGGPEIVGDDAYFATHDTIYKIDAASGKVNSKIKTPYLVYVIHRDGYLWTNERGLSKRKLSGEIVESVEFNSATGFKPVTANDLFILGGDTSSLYGVSNKMKILWKLKQSEAFWAPGIVKENIYYTGNRNGNIYAIRLPQS